MPEVEIHPTAQVSSQAEIGSGVSIGAYAVVGARVTIGDETRVGPYTLIEGPTIIGKRNLITGHAAIGTDPQDLKYQGEESWLMIGDDNRIREFVTLNRGTRGGGGKSTLGSRNLFMAGVHVGHDCHVGDDTIFGNAGTLGGHVEVRDHANVGAFSGVHPFCRVGEHAYIGGYSVVTRDALPFIKTVGYRNQAGIFGINAVGLRRDGFSAGQIRTLKQAYRWLFLKNLRIEEAIEGIRAEKLDSPDVEALIQFIENAKRGFVRNKNGGAEDEGETP